MLTVREGRNRGRALRTSLPRSAQADLVLPERDPVGILAEQNATRLPELVPVRIGRMLQSPFAFYRGTAAIMAHDLADAPVTGVDLVCCGDAHISNFGLYASPERRLLFDLNDFDEAGTGPWEWDVKRLAASVVLGGRDLGLSEPRCREAAQAAVRAYRLTLQQMYELTALERYYVQVEAERIERLVEARHRNLFRWHLERSRRRTSEQVRDKLTATDDNGSLRFLESPPTTRHVDIPSFEEVALHYEAYCASLRGDAAYLLTQFRIVDYVLRAVGVGSVGTRCYVVMLEGPSGAPLFLQVKEAPPSVLETYGRRPHVLPPGVAPPAAGPHGHRVVTSQRILQAQSDPFLGWISAWADAENPRPADYYWRQFRDMKGSVELQTLSRPLYTDYVSLCGQLLARAHCQSPGGSIVLGYVGRSERFDEAAAAWAVAYADQSERDFAALGKAVRAGRLPAETGV